MTMKELRRRLAARISPELAKEAERGSYTLMLVQESHTWLYEFRSVRHVLERITALVDDRYNGGDLNGVESSLGIFRENLRRERESETIEPDPLLERLYANTVVRVGWLEDRISGLLAHSTEQLNKIRRLRKLPPEEPFDGFKDCVGPDGRSFAELSREAKAQHYQGA